MSPGTRSETALESVHRALTDMEEQFGLDTVLELITLFTEKGAEQLTHVRDAVRALDTAALSAQAHSLKSSAANMGAQGVADLCLQLENIKHVDAGAQAVLTQLEHDFIAACIAMKAWKSTRSAAA